MDPATLTSIVQAIVTIVTTLSGVWAMFNKKNTDLEKKLGSRINNLEHQVKMSNQMMSRRNESVSGDHKNQM